MNGKCQGIRWWCIILLAALLCPAIAWGEGDEVEDTQLYQMVDESGASLTWRMGRMCVDDEYIASDNSLYQVIRVDDVRHVATAQYKGEEPPVAQPTWALFPAQAEPDSGKRLICMYSTHSDESYIPSDGASSLLENAGIYDVGEALKANLEELGVTVTYSKETFFPHDSGAYRRSRPVAAQLLKRSPDALIDIHRDGVPADQYETTVAGESISMVRLFVGRSNQNAAANRAFAKELKAVADKTYPGLIKDIYIGKGNYNQDLYGQSILLEFGTYKGSKEDAKASTEYMSKVIHQTLYGVGNASQRRETQEKGTRTGVYWLIGIAVAAAILFAIVQRGTFRGAGKKLARSVSELTGGWWGKRNR